MNWREDQWCDRQKCPLCFFTKKKFGINIIAPMQIHFPIHQETFRFIQICQELSRFIEKPPDSSRIIQKLPDSSINLKILPETSGIKPESSRFLQIPPDSLSAEAGFSQFQHFYNYFNKFNFFWLIIVDKFEILNCFFFYQNVYFIYFIFSLNSQLPPFYTWNIFSTALLFLI